MSERELLSQHQSLLGSLTDLPRKMIELQNFENIAEFVLHGLCREGNFNVTHAAYLVDNPDFDCLKGIAGFSVAELGHLNENAWANPDIFSDFMRESQFNQLVRSVNRNSARAHNQTKAVQEIAEAVGIPEHSVCNWELKHDNHGMLIYRKTDPNGPFDEHFIKSLYLLSFCPVF